MKIIKKPISIRITEDQRAYLWEAGMKNGQGSIARGAIRVLEYYRDNHVPDQIDKRFIALLEEEIRELESIPFKLDKKIKQDLKDFNNQLEALKEKFITQKIENINKRLKNIRR